MGDGQVSAEWWGRTCSSTKWSDVCKDLGGHRILGVWAKFWSDDALKFKLKLATWSFATGTVFAYSRARSCKVRNRGTIIQTAGRPSAITSRTQSQAIIARRA